MEVINELLNDQVYKRVLDKFSENGPYSFGVDYDTCRYYFERNSTIPNDFRALGGYINAICFGWKLVSDIPQVYRINELYANTFTSNGTYEYIKNHINEFDREFFKDTITSNEHSLYYLDTNCFSIMPLEYIDDEMISLAILCAPQYDYIDWFKTVCQRKKEAISVDVWKLAARLYGDVFAKDIIDMTPPEYKD